MKDPREWDEDYLLNLPAGEFDWIEFKASKGLDLTIANVRESAVLENLSKAISAFANSGGGKVVYGIKNPQPNRPLEVDDGGINSNIKNGTREWLEDVIPNLVDYPLAGFNVYTVKKSSNNSQIAPDKDIFVIQIPDSEQAPHQARDKKYYIRVGGKSVPINHRQVMDIVGRRQHPIIDLEFLIEESFRYPSSGLAGFYPERRSLHEIEKPREKQRQVALKVWARNNGSIYANYVIAGIYLPTSIIPTTHYRKYLSSGNKEEYKLEDDERTRYIEGKPYWRWGANITLQGGGVKSRGFGRSEYEPGWYTPILPTLSVDALTLSLNSNLKISELEPDDKILWTVYADSAPKRTGSIFVTEIEYVSNSEDDAD